MEKVTDEWLYYMINDCKIGGSLELALKELLKRRKEDNKHGVTYPLPCTNVEEKTVKEWIQKINEELDEFKAEIFYIVPRNEDIKRIYDSDYPGSGCDFSCVADEAMDTITAITSMLEYIGIDENERSKAQMRVNNRNTERGRL